MSDTDNQVAETTISDEELELDLTPDGTESEDELKEKLEKAETAKKQILARAKKAEAEAKALREAAVPKPAETPPVPANDDKLWEVAEMIQRGYTRADAEFIQRNGGAEALKDPNSYASIALKNITEQRRAEAEASKTADTTGMTAVERKYSPEKLASMTAEELEKVLPHAEG